MSKFEYDSFYGGYDEFAVNAEKYTKEEAIKIFQIERETYVGKPVIGTNKGEWQVTKAFVKWRAGINEDGKPCVGWWLEYRKREKGSCPVWAFHRRDGSKFEKIQDEVIG